MRSLKQSFILQLITSFFYAVTPLITFPYVSRVLGPEKIGAVNFIDYTAQIFLLFASFGIPLYGVREVAKSYSDKEKLQNVVSELFTIHIFSTLFCLIIFFVTVFSFEEFNNSEELIFLAAFSIVINAFSFDWFVQGVENFKFLSIRTLIIRFISVIAVFLFIRKASDFVYYYSILIGSSLIIILADILLLNKLSISLRLTFNIQKHIKPLLLFLLTTASVSVYTFLDTFLLGVISGSLAVGFYTTSLKIVKLSQNLINDLGGVILPRVSFLIESENSKEVQKIIFKSLYYVFTVSVPLSFFFFLLAPEIIIILAGSQFQPSIITLRLLSLLPLVIGLSNVFGIQLLIPYKREKEMLRSVLAGSILSVFLCILLCPLFEQNGAAIACLTSEIAVMILSGYYTKQIIHLIFPLRQIVAIITSTFLFIPIIFIIRNFFVSEIVILLTSLILCSIMYILLQYFLFTNTIVRESVSFVFGAIRKSFRRTTI